ncbi:MAG: ankyrin repeat domain-containing protein [Balneolaceae bacterium]|nr:ankyrin repeat domain-containing protein [Balneolaceae bacterium]
MNTIKGFFLAALLLIPALAMGWQQTGDEDFTLKNNLFEAIESIDYISLNLLLAEGAPVDTVDEKGNSPLMLAAKIGNPRILKIVLANEPEINHTNEAGRTALMIASEHGLVSVVESLLRHGARTGHIDGNGNTALTLASKFGYEEVVRLIQSQPVRPLLAK